MNILMNGELVSFNKDDFPMLVSGVCKAGASLFSIAVLVNVLKNGEKVLLFSAYPEAKVELKKQIEGLQVENAMIIKSGEEKDFINEISKVSDLSERVFLFKNIENYSKETFNLIKDQEFIIFSGDVDKCAFGEELVKKDFKTKIFFSYPEILNIENKIDLPKYNGLIISDKYNGLINLSI